MSGSVRRSGALQRRTNLTAFLFLLPNLLGFVLLTLLPIGASFVLAFMSWKGGRSQSFVGLANFQRLLTDANFWISLQNTAYYAVCVIPLTMIFALALALALNQRIKARNALRAVYFFPYVASLVAVTAVFSMLFEPSKGPINAMLMSLGIQNPPGWLTKVKWAMPVVIVVSVWRGMGYNMVLFLAGLQGVPAELYEAAELDGANPFRKFRHVTLPMIAPTTFFVLIMLTISSFKVFDLIAIMTNGGPGRATQVLVYYIYSVAFVTQNNFGYASAVALVLFFIVLAITIVQMRLERKWVNY